MLMLQQVDATVAAPLPTAATSALNAVFVLPAK